MKEWIPVSSGHYPKENETVQVTYIGYNDKKPHCDAFAVYINNRWYWAEPSGYTAIKTDIIAWRYYNDDPYTPPIGEITEMEFSVKFDRKIISKQHYISPGGYIFTSNNKSYQFDFRQSIGMIDKEDDTIIHFQVYALDKEYSDDLTKFDASKIDKIEDFYIFTGDDEPEIFPVKVLSLTITQGKHITEIDKKLLDSIKF